MFQNWIQYDSTSFFNTLKEYTGSEVSYNATYLRSISSLISLSEVDYINLRRHRYRLNANAAYSDPAGFYGNYGVREITSLNTDPSKVSRKVIFDYGDCHDTAINKTGTFNNDYSLINSDTNGASPTNFSTVNKSITPHLLIVAV